METEVCFHGSIQHGHVSDVLSCADANFVCTQAKPLKGISDA